MAFESKYNELCARKCIWNYHRLNVGHFASSLMRKRKYRLAKCIATGTDSLGWWNEFCKFLALYIYFVHDFTVLCFVDVTKCYEMFCALFILLTYVLYPVRMESTLKCKRSSFSKSRVARLNHIFRNIVWSKRETAVIWKSIAYCM